jgi:hypothetical protein
MLTEEAEMVKFVRGKWVFYRRKDVFYALMLVFLKRKQVF